MIVKVRSVWLWTFFKDQADFASHRYQVWRKHQLYLIAAQFVLMQKFRMLWQRFPITTAGIWSSLVASGSYNFQPLPFRLSCCSRLHRLFFLFENHVTQLCCCKQQPVAAKPFDTCVNAVKVTKSAQASSKLKTSDFANTEVRDICVDGWGHTGLYQDVQSNSSLYVRQSWCRACQILPQSISVTTS